MADVLVKQFAGLSLSAGEVAYRDQIMDAGFVGHFDFKSTYVKADYTGADNDELANLVDGADPAVATGTLPATAGGGLDQDENNEYIELPSDWVLPVGTAGEQHFLYCQWFKHDESYSYPVNSHCVGGATHGSVAENQYMFTMTSSAGVPLTWRAYTDGDFVAFSDISPFTDGEVHQLAVEFEATSATNYTRRVYLDGVVISTATGLTYSGSLQQPTSGSGAIPKLGYGSGFSTGYLRATHYRAFLKDFTQGGESVSAADLIAEDWERYSSRFS